MANLAPRVALWVGVLLIVIGLVCRYFLGLRGFGSLTAALFGMPLALLGFVATDPQYTRGAMRGVVGLTLLGLLSTIHALPLFHGLLQGDQQPDSPVSILARAAMLLLCTTLLGVCFATFVSSRLRRVSR